MKAITIALLSLLLTASTISAAPPSRPSCQLRYERNGQIAVVVRGPCYYSDFPARCRVPSRIAQGQRIYCPVGK